MAHNDVAIAASDLMLDSFGAADAAKVDGGVHFATNKQTRTYAEMAAPMPAMSAMIRCSRVRGIMIAPHKIEPSFDGRIWRALTMRGFVTVYRDHIACVG